ncbi:hypothetical protein ACHAPE_000770 [Trichoderma viride]
MTLPASESQMPDFGEIHHATMGCISGFKACMSIKPLMKDSWAESRLADLNLWASGVGALARPDMSLDRRLQFQPKPRLVLINLLLTLGEFISSCRTYVLNEAHGRNESTDNKAESEGTPVSPAESTPELTLGDDSDPTPSSASWFTALVSSAKSSSDTSTDSDVGDELDDLHSEVTLKEVMKDIDDILDQLILLGFAIRKSGTVTRLRKADSSFKLGENEDLKEHLEFILLNGVARKQKNGKDNVGITTRERVQEVTPEQRHLILANLRRRHRFRYARRHQQKLDQLTPYPPVAKTKPFVHTPEEHQKMTPGLNRSPASNDGKSPPTEDFPRTQPSTAPPQSLQAPEMSATTLSVTEGDVLQIAVPTPAAASRVSVSVATMHYPSPPPISQKMRGFKCPCCYQTLPEMYKNWSRWRKHLVEDLCPYTCPFPECPRPEALYISRAAWRDHVLQSHGAGQNWECLACVGTGTPNNFSSAEEFVSHNRTKHIDAISEDQIAVLQDTCRKILPPNIAQCPLCPWPQDEEAIPDAVANLEHVGNCIHEFSLYALPWAETLAVDATDQSNPALRKKVEEWLKSTCTEEEESADIQKVDIETFIFFPTQPLPTKQERSYIPEEYFAESSNESSQAERGTLSLDSDLPEARGTYSDDISDTASEESGMAGARPSLRKLEHDNYTVGWICALKAEYVAARKFLDEKHEGLESAPQDSNDYTLGSIGKHNVVIATLPLGEYGTASAATVARDMIRSFQNVRICLMVGIGGGVPSKNHDIRLGDIVVGLPKGGHGGLLQYHHSGNTHDNGFQFTGSLDQPPLVLRAALAVLQAQYALKGHRIEETADNLVQNDESLRHLYTQPDQLSDRLYQAGAIHPDTEESCLLVCDPHALIPRLPRDEDEDNLVIHYGLIVSLTQPMEDALLRDNIAAEQDVLCFETEAAGLMNNFPCLVIRGICDYSDSHKNKKWQRYAALVAAAYAKDLLHQLAPSSVIAAKSIKDILSDVYELDHNQHNQQRQAIFDWLTPVDYSPQHHDFISRRQEGTGQWFLRSPEFQTWLKNNGQTLFCPGIPGAGKTILAAIVIDHLLAKFQHDPHTGIAYIYCNFRRYDDQTVEKLLVNLLKQLTQRQSSLPKTVQDLYEKYGKSGMLPSLHQITAALHSTAATFEKVFFIIDALDECQNLAQTKLLDTLFDLQTEAGANILATSRINDDIKRRFDGCATVEISAANEDVLAYLNGQLSLRRSDFIDEDIQEKIRDAVPKAAGGSFVFAASHMDTIMNQPSRDRVEEVLLKLGKGMEEPQEFHYKQAMERIEGQTDAIRSLAKRTLTWITHAKRPLSIIEIQHALAVREQMTEFDSDYMPDVKDLKSACVGLVTTDEESGTIRLVHHSAQEFFQLSKEKWFPEGESYITKICLTYLLFSIFDGALCETDRELEDRLNLNPFYAYAACNWGHHARESSEASQEIMNFLESTVKKLNRNDGATLGSILWAREGSQQRTSIAQ